MVGQATNTEGAVEATNNDPHMADPLLEPSTRGVGFGEFVQSITDDIERVGDLWRQVARIKKNAFDPDYLEAITTADDLACGYDEVTSRHQRRSQTRVNIRFTLSSFKSSVALAQQCASLRILGNEAHLVAADSIVETEASDLEKAKSAVPPRSMHIASGELFFNYLNAVSSALDADLGLAETVFDWTEGGLGRFVNLLRWLRSDDCDEYAQHRPLVESLARMFKDPVGDSFIEQMFDTLANHPEMYQKTFMQEFASREVEPTKSDSDKDWFDFLGPVFSMAGTEITTERLIEILSNIDIELLPRSLRDRLTADHVSMVKEVRSRTEEIFDRHKHPGRFLLLDASGADRGETTEQRGKKRHKGGRATRSLGSRIDSIVEIEPLSHVTGAVMVIGSPDGHIRKPIASESIDLAQQLYDSKFTQQHLRKYSSDPSITEDVLTMLQSIIDEPRGNGCGQMHAIAPIRFSPSEGNLKDLPIWHLSPRQRHLQGSLGPLASNTRIYYVLIPNQDGSETIGLLDVVHKSDTTVLKYGKFRRT